MAAPSPGVYSGVEFVKAGLQATTRLSCQLVESESPSNSYRMFNFADSRSNKKTVMNQTSDTRSSI